MENFHLPLLNLRDDAVLGGVAEDEPLLHSPVQGVVEHHVDATDSGAAESRLLAFLGFAKPTIFHQVFVELLDVPAGEFVQFDAADPGDDVQFDITLIRPCRSGPDIGLGVERKPGPQPLRHRVVIGPDNVYCLAGLHRRGQLLLDLRLGLTQHILDDPLSGPGIVAGGVAAFPACAFSFSDTPNSLLCSRRLKFRIRCRNIHLGHVMPHLKS